LSEECEEIALLKAEFADFLTDVREVNGEVVLDVPPLALIRVCRFLREEQALACDFPADITAYDTGEQFVLWYRLYSMARNRTVILRVRLPRDNPVIPSVTPIWRGANWHERECYDLYGIQFEGHPTQDNPPRMRILLPKDWEGHPFRKDYVPVFSSDPLHGPQETN
jgi:NADH-quinone oxidoreductase subunit C